MDFTFGVCTYNSESYVINTLESIKFQIVNFSKNINCFLVISDDSSSDHTVCYIQNWLNLNSKLFAGVKLLTHKNNKGIANSYADLIQNIHTELFIKIDGDDLLCSENIFEKCLDLKKDECRIYVPFIFKSDAKVSVRDPDAMNSFYYSTKQFYNKDSLRLIETYKPFMTPQVIMTRSNFSDECLEFLRNFTQFEDDTTIWFIFKNNPNIKLKYFLTPLVLYRIQDKSLSNGLESIHQIQFLDDLHNLKKIMFKSSCSFCSKFFLMSAVWETFLMKHRFAADNCLHRKIFTHHRNRIRRRLENDEKFSIFLNQLDLLCKRETLYLKKIIESSKEFFEE